MLKHNNPINFPIIVTNFKKPLNLRKKSEASIMSKLSTSSSQSQKSQFQSLFSSRNNSTSAAFEDQPYTSLFKFEDGRRYINDDSIRYPLPNDEQEST